MHDERKRLSTSYLSDISSSLHVSYFIASLSLLNSLCNDVQLQYLIPRLLPEARGASITAGGSASEQQEENLPDPWSSATDAGGTWKKSAWLLWRHPTFCQLGQEPQYQVG